MSSPIGLIACVMEWETRALMTQEATMGAEALQKRRVRWGEKRAVPPARLDHCVCRPCKAVSVEVSRLRTSTSITYHVVHCLGELTSCCACCHTTAIETGTGNIVLSSADLL